MTDLSEYDDYNDPGFHFLFVDGAIALDRVIQFDPKRLDIASPRPAPTSRRTRHEGR